MKAPPLEPIETKHLKICCGEQSHTSQAGVQGNFLGSLQLSNLGKQTSIAMGSRDANKHTLSSRTPISRERNPASRTRIMPAQQRLGLLQMPRIALNHVARLALANRVSVARHNPKPAVKFSPKLGKTQPTVTLFL